MHAKLIALVGDRGIALYAGSSNFTRRGLGLIGARNWEAGLVYRLGSRDRKAVDKLVAFAGDPVELRPNLRTQEPERDSPCDVATFLSEVIATPTHVTVHFREPAPADLILLMPQDHGRYLVLLRGATDCKTAIALAACECITDKLVVIGDPGTPFPATQVEARWDGYRRASFPVRFDEKQLLPAAPGQRYATELELIDYYRRGWDPFRDPEGPHPPSSDPPVDALRTDDQVDTSRILSYFVRSFIEAIPGIEEEVRAAATSRPVLQSVLHGPTGVMTLARQVVTSAACAPGPNEPKKTAIAVGFQLVEIGAALVRCREAAGGAELLAELDAGIEICRSELDALASKHDELRENGFVAYRRCFLGGPR